MPAAAMLRCAAALACLAGTLAPAAPAQAQPPWRDGWHRPPPHRWGPPPRHYHPPRHHHRPRYYHPPPVYYAPPPVYYPPPAYYAPPGFSFGFTVPLR